MRDSEVKNAGQALAYSLDCQLATVTTMAQKKSTSKNEYSRQVSIAQKMLDWCVQFQVDIATTRGKDVLASGGNVEKWAAQYLPTK